MIDIVTAKGYMRDLARDSSWLTEYAQDKKDGQRLIDMTVTMNRARRLIAELISETKQVKYFDEDEKVWKVGSVIVNE